MVVRLIGIRPKKNKELKAMGWLFDKLKGERIYLKYDSPKYDENHRSRCYVYLKNKTFINLHLLRSELVELDHETAFRYLNKFKAVSRTPEMGDPPSVG
jgi:site-specific DNA-methyltransferase (adenine-specific)